VTRTPTWKEQQARAEVERRKQIDEQNRDPILEQCLIAYVNKVRDYGPRSWESFRREWMVTHGKAMELRMEKELNGTSEKEQSNG
jgi:adenosyl cobinamide kinase/adenosyl cobinamide phosphate guanylyltransferase